MSSCILRHCNKNTKNK